MEREFDVLLLGYYGFGNLGDELLAEAAVSLLESGGVKRERIALLSAKAAESEKKFGLRAFDRWSLAALRRGCVSSRTLLLGGGGLFQDSSSLRSCLYYYGVMRLAKSCGCRLWAEGQSVGPLHSAAARSVTRRALSLCSRISVRDENSAELLSSLGLDSSFIPDLVLSLPMPKGGGDGNYILFNARPGYEKLSRRAAESADAFARESGREIIGVALADEDEKELERLEALRYIKLRDIITVRGAGDFSEAAAAASGAVGMRLHFLILSFLSGIPLAGCAYDPKVSGFCRRYGIAALDGGALRLTTPDESAAKEAAEAVRAEFAAAVRLLTGDIDG
ncbi:MAG: polysaccharide pyruvyl transferase CsaB [Synergistaceae bacterium]|nr:polysaccharide pyruvyl transferase CsaB [Synergistaceae bacterium]